MATVHDQIRAFAELQHRPNEWFQRLCCLLVAGPLRQILERLLDVQEEFQDFSISLRSLAKPSGLTEQIQVGKQADGSSLRQWPNLDSFIRKDRRKIFRQESTRAL